MKKILIGSYFLIMIGIIVVISSTHVTDRKTNLSVATGAKVYQQQCVICHGKTGKGEGAKAGTAINNQHFLNTVTDSDLYNYIKFGRYGTAMPSYGPRVKEKDLKSLVTFMRNWQTEEMALTAPKRISGNIENGKKYYQLYCASCHGTDAAGKKNMGTALANSQYLAYTSNKQIWISTAYGREDTRMGPSLKGLEGARQLSKNTITDVVSYIRSLQK